MCVIERVRHIQGGQKKSREAYFLYDERLFLQTNAVDDVLFQLLRGTVEVNIIHNPLLRRRILHHFFFLEPDSNFAFGFFW